MLIFQSDADFDEKKGFSKINFQVNNQLLDFEYLFAIFRKLRGRKSLKFFGQFLTLENMVTKFFRNSNFSDFF